MQHHGAPTRLLDFTYSIYVAAYFALETATASDGGCAVWALDGPWALDGSVKALDKAGKLEAERLLERPLEGYEKVVHELWFKEPHAKAACPLNPFRLNERLRIQKGAFLVPGDVQASFMENLEALPGHNEAAHVVKIVIPFELRREALRELFQMNVTRTSLFPGLDGYAQSLGIYHPVFEGREWLSGQGSP